MAKFEFNRDHARKLAEALYGGDIPMRCCDDPCSVCDTIATDWEDRVEKVFKALKSVEGDI